MVLLASGMKVFAFLTVVTAGGFAAVFNLSPSARESIRAWQMTPAQRAAYDGYQQGKAVFIAHWSIDPKTATFATWGDDALVGAQPLRGDIWLASGRVSFTLMGTPVRQPWAVGFNKRTGEFVAYSVGAEAGDAVERVRRGEVNLEPQTSTIAPAPNPGRAVSYDPATRRYVEHQADVSGMQSRGGGGNFYIPPTPVPPAKPGDWMWKQTGALDSVGGRAGGHGR